MRTRTIALVASILFLLPMQAQKTPNIEKKWAWLGFERPAGANPIVRPDTTSRFYCPMWKRVAQWENSETFNPAFRQPAWKQPLCHLGYSAANATNQP